METAHQSLNIFAEATPHIGNWKMLSSKNNSVSVKPFKTVGICKPVSSSK